MAYRVMYLQAPVEDLLSLGTSYSAVYRDLLIPTDTKGTHGVAGCKETDKIHNEQYINQYKKPVYLTEKYFKYVAWFHFYSSYNITQTNYEMNRRYTDPHYG